MLPTYRKEMDRICVGYERVHKDTRMLYEQMEAVSTMGAVLVAVARGGWLTTRLLAASYEEAGIENESYSVSATYKRHGTPDEYVALTQALDANAIENINEAVFEGSSIFAVDSVCQTGRELAAVKGYLCETFPEASVSVGVMNWVTYRASSRTPWRTVELEPDFYGSHIDNQQMPYIEYPWEYSATEDFNQLKGLQ